MDPPRAHAVLLVALDGPHGRPPRVRTFHLLDVEREPEPHFQDTPVGTRTEAGTRPASRSARHAHWVEASTEPPHEGAKGTRAAPYRLREVMVARGPVGELLAQEFLDAYAEADDLLALQARVDGERAATDATKWDAARKAAIETAQKELEDAFYRALFPLPLVLVVLSDVHRETLLADLRALTPPQGRLVDLGSKGP